MDAGLFLAAGARLVEQATADGLKGARVDAIRTMAAAQAAAALVA